MKYYYLLLLLLVCCQPDDCRMEKMCLNPDMARQVELSSISDSIYAVSLQTNDTCLISNIRDMLLYEDRIYILDMDAAKVFIFDKQGKCLSVIDNRGEGPQEYISLSCFYINKQNETLVLVDNQKKKEHIYSLNGRYLDSTPTEFKILSATYLDSGEKLLVRNQVDASANTGFLLNVYKQDLLLGQYLPFHYENGASIMSKDHGECVYRSSFYYNSLNSDTVYYYEKGLFEPRFLVDFGKYGIPKDIEALPQSRRSSSIAKYLSSCDYKAANWFSILLIKNNKMLVSYAYDKQPYFGVYDMNKNRVETEFFNPTIGGCPVYSLANMYFAHDDCLLFVTNNYRILNGDDDYSGIKDACSGFYDKIQEINMESNPIILVSRLSLFNMQ